jgi:pectate lyase
VSNSLRTTSLAALFALLLLPVPQLDRGQGLNARAQTGIALGAETTLDSSAAGLAAFPGAEGWGAQAWQACDRARTRVVAVTNLADAGEGSLRAALTDAGPRVVVFKVAGVVALQSPIDIRGDRDNSCLHVAGQTAPGSGITIGGFPLRLQSDVHDVIIRYLRFRTNGQGNLDIDGGHDIILDHSSFSWTTDDSIDIWRSNTRRGGPIRNVTVQRSVHSEIYAVHSTAMNIGGEHALGYEKQVENISIHHNLFGHDSHRNPNLSTLATSVVNNVMYNWKYKSSISKMGAVVDFVGNYFKPGPMTTEAGHEIVHESTDELLRPYPDRASIYVAGNARVPDFTDETADNWPLLWDEYLRRPVAATFKRAPWGPLPPAPHPITVDSASAAYDSIVLQGDVGSSARLNCQGGWVINRDRVDARVLADTVGGTQWFGFRTLDRKHRPPADLAEAGGYPPVDAGIPCADGDDDGIPDEWEVGHGLDPTRNDAAIQGADGYTGVERYVNGLP